MPLEGFLPVTRRTFLKSPLLLIPRILPLPSLVSSARAESPQKPRIIINNQLYPLDERNNFTDPSGNVVTDVETLEKIVEVNETRKSILQEKEGGMKIKIGDHEWFLPAQTLLNPVVKIQDAVIKYAQNLREVMIITAKVTKALLMGSSLSEAITQETMTTAAQKLADQEPKESLQQLASHIFHELREKNAENFKIARATQNTNSLTDTRARKFRENARLLREYFVHTLDLFKEATSQEINQGEWTKEFSLPIKELLGSSPSLEQLTESLKEKLQARVDLYDPWYNFKITVLENKTKEDEIEREWKKRIKELAKRLAKKQSYEISIEYPKDALEELLCTREISDEKVYGLYHPKHVEELARRNNISVPDILNALKYDLKRATGGHESRACFIERKVFKFVMIKNYGEVAILCYENPFYPGQENSHQEKFVIFELAKIGNYWYLCGKENASDSIVKIMDYYQTNNSLAEKRDRFLEYIRRETPQ